MPTYVIVVKTKKFDRAECQFMSSCQLNKIYALY